MLEAIILIAVYFFLMFYLFPKMGIQTWVSGACKLPEGEKEKNTESEESTEVQSKKI
jgi:hypothetical protein